MAPPVYDGADVEETHEHYNSEGELVGTTRVLKHSPWDEDARAEAEANYEADHLICPSCGNLLEDCADPEKAWYPQRRVCYAARAQATADRRYGDKHDKKPYHNGDDSGWAEKPTERSPFHYRDGVRVWVSEHDLSPEDHFI